MLPSETRAYFETKYNMLHAPCNGQANEVSAETPNEVSGTMELWHACVKVRIVRYFNKYRFLIYNKSIRKKIYLKKEVG